VDRHYHQFIIIIIIIVDLIVVVVIMRRKNEYNIHVKSLQGADILQAEGDSMGPESGSADNIP